MITFTTVQSLRRDQVVTRMSCFHEMSETGGGFPQRAKSREAPVTTNPCVTPLYIQPKPLGLELLEVCSTGQNLETS